MKHIIIIFTAIILVSCGKDPLRNLSDEDSRIYITNHDRNVDFKTYQTFSVADSVLFVEGNSARTQLNATDAAFINALTQQLTQLGYSQVGKDEQPDLGVQVSVIIQTGTGFVTFPDYFGFWDPFYWGLPGAGWGFPPVWGVASYQIREGVLAFDMVDLKNGRNGGSVPLIWNGLIRGSGIFNASTAQQQVAQLIQQSPYLGNN